MRFHFPKFKKNLLEKKIQKRYKKVSFLEISEKGFFWENVRKFFRDGFFKKKYHDFLKGKILRMTPESALGRCKLYFSIDWFDVPSFFILRTFTIIFFSKMKKDVEQKFKTKTVHIYKVQKVSNFSAIIPSIKNIYNLGQNISDKL